MWTDKLDVDDGLLFVDRLVRDRVADFQMAKAALPSYGPEMDIAVEKYVEAIELWVMGSIEWMFCTNSE